MRRRSHHRRKRSTSPRRFGRVAFAAAVLCLSLGAWYLVMVTDSVGASYHLRDLSVNRDTMQAELEEREDLLSTKLTPFILEDKIREQGFVPVANAEYVRTRGAERVAKGQGLEQGF